MAVQLKSATTEKECDSVANFFLDNLLAICKLEKINNGCFRNCDYLQKLVFGTITRVDDTDGLLIPNNSRNTIDLVLSEQQKLLTNDGHGIWTPATSDERYSGSSESNKNQFFGYIFKSIRFK